MRTWLASLLLLATACGADDDGSESPRSCAAPTGDYTLTFWPRSGTCDLINAVVAPGGVPPVTGCEGGSETWSEDRCTAEYFGRCPAEDPYAVAELQITVRWAEDASTASGDATLRAYDEAGALVCTGTYEIMMTPYTE